jgi:hypothetical protein
VTAKVVAKDTGVAGALFGSGEVDSVTLRGDNGVELPAVIVHLTSVQHCTIGDVFLSLTDGVRLDTKVCQRGHSVFLTLKLEALAPVLLSLALAGLELTSAPATRNHDPHPFIAVSKD